MHEPVHPGEVLKSDVFEDLGVSVSEAADALGVSRVSLSRVVNGRASLTVNLANRLELAGISTARMWLGLQSSYDLARVRREENPVVRSLVA